MKINIKVAGFGGQGVMMFGQFLAYAATNKNLFSLWFPSYGPETRGGTANCSVILSDNEIESQVFKLSDCLVAFNKPSLEKFISSVDTKGFILYNSSLITGEIKNPNNLKLYPVPANDIATKIGLPQAANMVMAV